MGKEAPHNVRMYVLNGGAVPPTGGGIFGVVCPLKSIGILTAVFAKTAEPIEMPFGGLTHVVPKSIDRSGSRSDEFIRRLER